MSEDRRIRIVQNPHIFGGRPTVDRHRVTVHDIAALHLRGDEPRAIAEAFHLTEEQVLAALAYYHDHREQIECELQEDTLEIARLAAQDTSPPRERLRQALRERDARSPHG